MFSAPPCPPYFPCYPSQERAEQQWFSPPVAFPQQADTEYAGHNFGISGKSPKKCSRRLTPKASAKKNLDCTWRPSQEEVCKAVASLYEDGLKPFGRLLLKRVRELAAFHYGNADDLEQVPRVDPDVLCEVARSCESLKVELEDGREYSVHFVDVADHFVEVSSAQDIYPAELWEAFREYLNNLDDKESVLPGGRYACANAMIARNLPWLRHRSLGEVCHIVQLAISQKRLLGYNDGHMVPFHMSEEKIKEKCASMQLPVDEYKKGSTSFPHVTWSEAQTRLVSILHDSVSPGEYGVVTLSNVKRLFRSKFRCELSETVLGYSRLYDLLKDHRFDGVCRVEPQSNGQVIVHSVTPTPASRNYESRRNSEHNLSEDSTTPPSSCSSNSAQVDFAEQYRQCFRARADPSDHCRARTSPHGSYSMPGGDIQRPMALAAGFDSMNSPMNSPQGMNQMPLAEQGRYQAFSPMSTPAPMSSPAPMPTSSPQGTHLNWKFVAVPISMVDTSGFSSPHHSPQHCVSQQGGPQQVMCNGQNFYNSPPPPVHPPSVPAPGYNYQSVLSPGGPVRWHQSACQVPSPPPYAPDFTPADARPMKL